MTIENSKLKQAVKEKYAGIALDKNCCCSTKSKDAEYSVFNESYQEMKGYVEEADLNLGCGVPTEYAAMKPGDSVIDLGCGAGNDCFVARAIVGAEGHVTGLDFTDEMLEKAKKNARTLGFDNVEFVKGDIEKIPLGDHLFDVAISNCVLNLVPDKEKAFGEILRILKPGGHFCVSDIVLKGELTPGIRDAAVLYAGCVSGALQMEDYLEVIEKAGFDNVEVKRERVIDVPDEMFLEHVSQEELHQFRQMSTGIFSITVVGYR